MKLSNKILSCAFGLLLSLQAVGINFKVSGVNDEVQANVLAYVDALTIDCAALVSPISQQHIEVKEKVKTATQPFGYFNTEVNIKAKTEDSCEQVLLEINLGPLTTIGTSEIEVVGSDDQDFIEVRSQFKLDEGMPLNQLAYQNLKRKWVELANEKLYLDAKFNVEKLVVIQAENTADIELVFNTGPRYPISQVNVDISKPILNDRLMDKLIAVKQHHYTTQSDLYLLRQKLVSYGYFASVTFAVDEDNKNDKGVPLNITLTPASKYDYSAGLGYSTDLGVKTSFKYNNHRINTRGHQLVSHVDLSQIRNELGVGYKIPSGSQPASKWYNIQLVYRDELVENIDSQTSKLGFSQTRIRDNKWQNIYFIDILHETFDTGVDDGEALLLVPGVSWSLRQADNFSRPSNGYKIQSEFKGAAEDLLSDASFAQITVGAKYIHGLGESNRMIYRAQAGGTASSDFDEIPTTYRFFTGGDQTIRGYDYQSISPLNDSGDVAGGKHMLVGSVEFEHQFAEQWAFAVFTDFGDSFNHVIDIKQSVGTGVRWFSPIGPIRLDIGVPLNTDENDFRIHVTIGPDL